MKKLAAAAVMMLGFGFQTKAQQTMSHTAFAQMTKKYLQQTTCDSLPHIMITSDHEMILIGGSLHPDPKRKFYEFGEYTVTVETGDKLKKDRIEPENIVETRVFYNETDIQYTPYTISQEMYAIRQGESGLSVYLLKMKDMLGGFASEPGVYDTIMPAIDHASTLEEAFKEIGEYHRQRTAAKPAPEQH